MAKLAKAKKLAIYGKEARQYIDELSDVTEQPIIVMDGFDAAIVGVTEIHHTPVVVYSYQMMIDVLMVRDQMSEDDAAEYIDYNCFQSGPGYPLIIHHDSLPIAFRICVSPEQQVSHDERQLALPL